MRYDERVITPLLWGLLFLDVGIAALWVAFYLMNHSPLLYYIGSPFLMIGIWGVTLGFAQLWR